MLPEQLLDEFGLVRHGADELRQVGRQGEGHGDVLCLFGLGRTAGPLAIATAPGAIFSF